MEMNIWSRRRISGRRNISKGRGKVNNHGSRDIRFFLTEIKTQMSQHTGESNDAESRRKFKSPPKIKFETISKRLPIPIKPAI